MKISENQSVIIYTFVAVNEMETLNDQIIIGMSIKKTMYDKWNIVVW